jgi:drug/metabolite transporter (DMT)-like permease
VAVVLPALPAWHANSAPVFAIGVAAVMGIEPSWLQIVGGIVVMAGIAQLQLRQMRRARP